MSSIQTRTIRETLGRVRGVRAVAPRLVAATVAIVLVAAAVAGAASFAALSWNNIAGGSASTAANWTPNQVPTSADDLTFNLAASYPVTFNASTTASRTQTFRQGAVTLTASSPHTISNGVTIASLASDVATATLTTGTVTSNAAVVVGGANGAVGTLNVNDDDADLLLATSAGDLTVGNNGDGNLNITGGGRVQVADRFVSGGNSSSQVDISVTGLVFAPAARSWLDVLGTSTASTVGSGGDVVMDVADGGMATFAGSLNIAQGSFSASSLTVGGSGTSIANVSVGGELRIAGNTSDGSAGGFGVVSIENLGALDVGGTLEVGNDPDGGTAFLGLESGGEITTGSLTVGATGELDLNGGALHVDGGTFTYANPNIALLLSGPNDPLFELIGATTTLSSGPNGRALTVGSAVDSTRGTFHASSASTVTLASGDIVLGETSDSFGVLKVLGGSSLTMPANETVSIGLGGSGYLAAFISAEMELGDVEIGVGTGSSGVLQMISSTATMGRVAVGGSAAAPGGAGILDVAAGSYCAVTKPGLCLVVHPEGSLDVEDATLDADSILITGDCDLDNATLNATLVDVRSDIMASGTINADVSIPASDGSVTVQFPGLTLGNPLSFGIRNFGVLDCLSHPVTILHAGAAIIGTVHLVGSTLTIPSGATIMPTDSLYGTGTVDADLVNAGRIVGAFGGLTFKGIVNGVGQGFRGEGYTRFEDGGGFVGSGTIESAIYGDSTSTIVATGNLTMGNGPVIASFGYDGALDVGPHTVALVDGDSVMLGGTTSITGGTLIATDLIVKSGGVIEGSGTVGARIIGHFDSRITALGDLTIGDNAAAEGLFTYGALDVGANTVTVLTASRVELGRTTLAGGTLTHTGNSHFMLSGTDSLTGWGNVERKVRFTDDAVIRADGPLTFNVPSGPVFAADGGTLDVNSNTVTFVAPQGLGLGCLTRIAGGTLISSTDISISDTLRGFGTVDADYVSNVGVIEVGDAIGTLVVNGDLDNGGTIAVQIGGSGSEPGAAESGGGGAGPTKSQSVVCDRLVVNGVADLSAFDVTTLRIGQLPGVDVAVGNVFTIVTADSIVGQFGQIVFDDPYLDNMFDVQYAATRVTLVATAATGVDLPPIGDPTGGAPADGGLDAGGAIPERFALRLASRNPFGASDGASFEYDIPRGGAPVALSVFDVSGRRVANLVEGARPAGTHRAEWGGAAVGALPSGVYFLRMDAGGFGDTKRLVLLR